MARKCNRLCHFSSATGECRKPGKADCPAGLPTNEQRIRAMSTKELAGVIMCPHDGVGCENPREHCISCCAEWLQQVAEEESAW